jgi:hypothetical protein
MTIHPRFSVNGDHIIDAINPPNICGAPSPELGPQDERQLREHILWKRLYEITPKLMINQAPIEKSHTGAEYQPWNQDSYALSRMIFRAICASHLNTCDPSPVKQDLDIRPRRDKKGAQALTSIRLFVDDVENLLTDLYRETETKSLDSAVHAVFVITEEFTRYARADLWKEHQNAVDWDYGIWGIGLPEGYGVSGSEWRRGMRAGDDLAARAHTVRFNPSLFSEYTVEFVRLLDECPGFKKAPSPLLKDEFPF